MLNVAFTVPALWLFLTGQLLRPRVRRGDRLAVGRRASASSSPVIVVVVIGVAVWDIIDGFLKAARNRGGSALGGY